MKASEIIEELYNTLISDNQSIFEKCNANLALYIPVNVKCSNMLYPVSKDQQRTCCYCLMFIVARNNVYMSVNAHRLPIAALNSAHWDFLTSTNQFPIIDNAIETHYNAVYYVVWENFSSIDLPKQKDCTFVNFASPMFEIVTLTQGERPTCINKYKLPQKEINIIGSSSIMLC